MSAPREPAPAMLLVSVLSASLDELWGAVLGRLVGRFGPALRYSRELPFAHTHYYDEELGAPIRRRLVAFDEPYAMGGLPEAKFFTNRMERSLARPDGRRRVNLDPGLLTAERLVLASGKNFNHRVYLGRGIWADLTLVYTRRDWQVLPWTFPDYAAPDMRDELTLLRTIHLDKQRNFGQPVQNES